MGLHGALIYQLGIWPLIYQQHFSGEGDPALIDTFIRDRIRGYLAQVHEFADNVLHAAPSDRGRAGHLREARAEETETLQLSVICV